MHIHCDHCGAEVLKEDALTHVEEEQVYYFCSLECLENKDYTPEPEAEPEEPSKATQQP